VAVVGAVGQVEVEIYLRIAVALVADAGETVE
jgi:hypothetical protein